MKIQVRELVRKALHLTGLLYIIALQVLGREKTLVLSFLCLCTAIILELIRLKYWHVFPFKRLFEALARDIEKRSLSGYLYFFVSSTLVILLFSPKATSIAITASIIGDVASAIVGIHIGKRRLIRDRDKTLEGLLAGAFSIALLAFIYPLPLMIIATLTFIFVEVVNRGVVNDNLLHPLAIGLTIQGYLLLP